MNGRELRGWKSWACGVCLLFGAAVGSKANAEDVDAVVARLEAAHARVTAYTASVRSRQEFSEKRESIRIETEGTVAWKRDGEKILFRSEAADHATRKRGDDIQQSKSKSLFVCDGNVFWAYTEEGEMKNVMMAKPDPLLVGSPKMILDRFRSDHDLKLLKDEVVDGADCHVIELKARGSRDASAGRIVLRFRKEDGINVQHVGYDTEGRKVSEKTLSAVRTNVEIPPDQFTFTVPEGVNVMDFINNPEPAP